MTCGQRARTGLTRFHARTLVAVTIVLIGGCGGRERERRDGIAGTPVTPSGESTVPPPLVGDALAMRTVLARACLRGDPLDGAPWMLSDVEEDFQTMAIRPLATLATRDSARLAARIARATDALPSDTSLADFRGLPVVVLSAWLVAPTTSDTIVIALVSRRLPIESSPLEESFLLVAMPGSRQGVREPLVEGWYEREAGAEDVVAVRELVAALQRGDGRLSLILVRNGSDGPIVELLTRTESHWAVEWSGALPSCP